MIQIILSGGMGNQMFQYALGRRLAHDLDTDLVLDGIDLLDRSKGPDFVYRNYDLDVFTVEPDFRLPLSVLRIAGRLKSNLLTRAWRRVGRGSKPIVREAHFHYDPTVIERAKSGSVLKGWFQSPRYFAPVEDTIRLDFRFRGDWPHQSGAIRDRIEQSESVCLNVRRTDFLRDDLLNATDREYFLRAADYLAERLTAPRFYVFSDDVEWCRRELRLPYDHEIVGHEHKGRKFGNYLRLMSRCHHFIIPNSSFAWWAVWLRNSPEAQVVAPKHWFTDTAINTQDLIPAEWIRL